MKRKEVSEYSSIFSLPQSVSQQYLFITLLIVVTFPSGVFHILAFSENPISCSCESQELWEWLKDHQKLVERHAATDTFELRCEHPAELRGKLFLDLEPEQFCDQPIVVKLGIQDIQPFSVLVSWQSRNHSGLNGYQVVYYSTDRLDEMEVGFFF